MGPGAGAEAGAGAGGVEVLPRGRAEGGAGIITTTAAASTEIGWSAAEERTVSAGVLFPAVETAGGQMKRIVNNRKPGARAA